MTVDYETLVIQQRKYIEKVLLSDKLRLPMLCLSGEIRQVKREYLSHIPQDSIGDEFHYLSRLVDKIDKNRVYRYLNKVLHIFEDMLYEAKYHNKRHMICKKMRQEGNKYLAIVCIIKNEARYIREWIAYYKLMGVDHIFLFDNGSTDNIKATIEKEISEGFVSLYNFIGANAQLPVYRLSARALRGKYRWVAYIDADEFVVPTEGNLEDYLKTNEQFPAVGINWIVYGTGGHTNRPEGLVTENYLYTFEDKNNLLNLRIKSIVDPGEVYDIYSPHYCIIRKGKYAVDEDGEEITTKWMFVSGSGPAFTGENKTTKIRINHYWTKSEQDLLEKCNRGYAAGSFSPDYENIMKRLNYPQCKDETILPYVERIKEMLFL